MKLRVVDLCKTWRREAAKQLTKTPPYGEALIQAGSERSASLSLGAILIMVAVAFYVIRSKRA